MPIPKVSVLERVDCTMFIACEQALWGALAVGREKEGELATPSLEYEFHLQFPVAPRLLSCQISAMQSTPTRVIMALGAKRKGARM